MDLIEDPVGERIGDPIFESPRLTERNDDLREEMRRLEATLIRRMEAIATRMETIWRESSLGPLSLDAHRRMLDDHEARLVRLEAPSRAG